MAWRGQKIAQDHLTDEQREALDGGAQPLQRADMWGSSASIAPANNPAGSVGTPSFDVPFIDVGPFDEPCEIEVFTFSNDITAGVAPELRVRQGNGRSMRTFLQPLTSFDPLVFVAQSLSIAMHRTDAIPGQALIHMWCRRRVSGVTRAELLATLAASAVQTTAPKVFDETLLVFGAGAQVASVAIPAGALWVQSARGNDTTQLDLRQTVGGALTFSRLMTAAGENFLASLALVSKADALVRSPFVNAENNLLKWLR